MGKLYTSIYPKVIVHDCLGLLLGKKLGAGAFRDVYEFTIDPDCVVKVEARDSKEGPGFSNVHEHAIWCESKGHGWRKWLAPVVFISTFGTTLIQRRTKPMKPEERPALVPNFLADLKLSNWGMFEGRPVVHDYGNHAIYALARDRFDLIEGRWHDGQGNTLPAA